ncbi:MAG TPA: hypothetical protein PLV92_21035, partial [Pirellulaceae bacterium]|nr:hypothetical protein [Pirellulaceae bacterium]
MREVDADGASSGRQVDAGANKTANARDLSSELSGGGEVKIDGFFGVVNREDWFKFMIAGGPGTATPVTFRLNSSDPIDTLVEIIRVTKNSRGETVNRRVTRIFGLGEIPQFPLTDGSYLIHVVNPKTRDATYTLSVTQSAANSTLFRGSPADGSTGGTGTGATSGDGDVLPPDSSGDGDGGANGGNANGDGAPSGGGAGPLDYAPPVDLILAPNDGDAINVGWHRTDLESQTVIQSAPAGGEKVFFFWLTNNTSEPAQYVVTGSGRDEAGYVDYFDRELPLTDGNNITYAVASESGWTTPVVAPGSTISLRAHVHPAPNLNTGDEKPALLTARQVGHPENTDTVRGIVRAIANRPPVLDEVGPIYFEPNEWSRSVTLTSHDGAGGPVTYYVGKVFSSDPATRQLIDRLGITEWLGDQGNTLGLAGNDVRWLKAGDRRYYIEPSGALREATGGPAVWSAGPVVEILDRRYYDDPNLLFRPAAGTVTVQGDRLTATRYPGFSGEFIAYVYATTGGTPYGVTLRLFTTESADLL